MDETVTASTDAPFVFDWEAAFNDTNKEKKPIILSESREIVLVPGGRSEKIRNLIEMRPDICWQYVGSSVLVLYNFNLAKIGEKRCGDRLGPANRSHAALPLFYARLPYRLSPVDFSVQPKCLDRARDSLHHRLNAVYTFDMAPFDDNHIFDGIPCVVWDVKDNQWMRARLLKYIPGAIDVIVRYADVGIVQIVPYTNVRPLLAEFGRIPPLALACRIKGIDVNDLYTHKVTEFQDIVDSVNSLVRVELTNTHEPYLVNLYHPTVVGWNIGRTFYPAPLNDDQIAREQRINRPQCSQNSDVDDGVCSCSNDDDDDDEVSSPPHVFRFDRVPKPFADLHERFTIAHIENTRLIYLHSIEHQHYIDTIEPELAVKWNECIPFPERALIAGNACLYRMSNSRVVRAVIDNVPITKGIVVLQAIDHGWLCTIQRADTKQMLRAVPAQYNEPPRIYVGRIAGARDNHPHYSETLILRRLLPIGASVAIRFEKRKDTRGGAPHKMTLITADGYDVVNRVEEEKLRNRVLHPCKALMQYNAHRVQLLHPIFADDEYVDRMQCSMALTKGRLELVDHTVSFN